MAKIPSSKRRQTYVFAEGKKKGLNFADFKFCFKPSSSSQLFSSIFTTEVFKTDLKRWSAAVHLAIKYTQRHQGYNFFPKIKALSNRQTLFREKTTLEGNCPCNNGWLSDEENLKLMVRTKTK